MVIISQFHHDFKLFMKIIDYQKIIMPVISISGSFLFTSV